VKIILNLSLVAAVFLLSGCPSSESYSRSGYNFAELDKVAVLDVQGQLKSEASKNQIADFFSMELLKKGYSPIERTQVQSILTEQQFQASEVTRADEAAQAGRILNVPAVLLVNVPAFGENISITAKLIDVEDGSILWMGTGTGTTGKLLSTIAGAATGAAVGVATTGDDDQVIGGVAGGVLGGVAGRALSPQETKKAKEIISMICKDLPQR